MALFTPSKGYKTLDFQSNTDTRSTTSVSGITFRVKTGAQQWRFKLQSPSLSRADMMADYSFIVQLDGQLTGFTIIPPGIGSARGTASSTWGIDTTTSTDPLQSPAIGSSNVALDNTGGGTLLKGDLIKFSNHDKVYMVTADTNVDGSTKSRLSFYPPLIAAVAADTTVVYDNVPIKVFQDKDQIKFITQTNGTYKYELVLNEDI